VTACPCGSGAPYAACCAPLHRGEREAPDASALMRSRYAAFATKDVGYLWRTLHADHDDSARPEEQVIRELREACSTNRYLGLRVVDAREPGADGIARVLFVAKVFRKGRDLSFVEASDFARDGEAQAWRYLRGDAQPLEAVGSLGELTLQNFGRRGPFVSPGAGSSPSRPPRRPPSA